MSSKKAILSIAKSDTGHSSIDDCWSGLADTNVELGSDTIGSAEREGCNRNNFAASASESCC
jgi:hypothetical protein